MSKKRTVPILLQIKRLFGALPLAFVLFALPFFIAPKKADASQLTLYGYALPSQTGVPAESVALKNYNPLHPDSLKGQVNTAGFWAETMWGYANNDSVSVKITDTSGTVAAQTFYKGSNIINALPSLYVNGHGLNIRNALCAREESLYAKCWIPNYTTPPTETIFGKFLSDSAGGPKIWYNIFFDGKRLSGFGNNRDFTIKMRCRDSSATSTGKIEHKWIDADTAPSVTLTYQPGFRDIAITRISGVPGIDSVNINDVYLRNASIKNNSDLIREQGQAILTRKKNNVKLDSLVQDFSLEPNHFSPDTAFISFADWNATVNDTGINIIEYKIVPSDSVPENNIKSNTVFVKYQDFTVTRIISPDIIYVDSSFIPKAMIKSLSNYPSNTQAHFLIGSYQDSAMVSLNPTESLGVSFNEWIPSITDTGSYEAKCFIATIDNNPTNDTARKTIRVNTPLPPTPGWSQKESIPHAPDLRDGKYVKDGGALTVERGKIYALYGNKSWQFYKYTSGLPGFWTQLESVPYGPKPTDPNKINKKKPSKGGALCAESNRIYATKGNGTTEFWAYLIDDEDTLPADTWIQLTSVPVRKGLKGGTSILHWGRQHFHKIYLLAGGQKKTDSLFFAYNINADTSGGTPWETLPSIPKTPDNKAFKDGSCIVLADKKIWALKGGGKYNTFWMYDSVAKTWTERETIPMVHPDIGRKKKVKAGGAMTVCDDLIYAIKGGGSNEFWAYNPDDSTWTPKDTIPRLNKKSVPKGGAALTEHDDMVWLLKGNNTPEFWKYTPEAETRNMKQEARNKLVGQGFSLANLKVCPTISIVPNPLTKHATIRYTVPISGKVTVKLYNATGKLVEILNDNYLNAGIYTTTLSTKNLAKGIYFLRYNDNTNQKEIKLIVQ